MSNLLNERNELLEAVKAPDRKKKQPSNFALYAALIFANLVFCLLDIISGFTVYWMTAFWLYGILTFLAGFAPLLLHELLFTRAFASQNQKNIAILGACAALVSIVLIGVMAGYVNIIGVTIAPQNSEIATIIMLVLIASFHALLAVIYYFIDPGISAQQLGAQAMARAIAQGDMIALGDYILEITQKSVNKRNAVGNKHNAAALSELLAQMGLEDANHDGIPDVFQRQTRPMNQYSQTTERPVIGKNHGSSEDNPNS